MFATILRRWRLVTPLVLAVLAISIVSGGMLMPASAHNIKFHFFGRALALLDREPIPNSACDTGYLPLHGGSLDTGHCFGAAGPGEPGAGVTGGVTNGITSVGIPTTPLTFGRLYAIFADSTVSSTHGNVSGKVMAEADLEGGISVCIVQADCNALLLFPGQKSITKGCAFITISATVAGVTLGPTTFLPTAFCAGSIEEKAYAFCHRRSDGSTQASVSAIEPKLNTPAVDENGRIFYIGDDNGNPGLGLANQTFTVSGGPFDQAHHYGILVTLNEQHPFVDGDLGAISATGVHIVVTDNVDVVQADFYIAHVFAGIHCAKHLGTEQNMGTLVGD